MKKILFLTLKVFSATGGIEKVCRVAAKALNEIDSKDDNGLQIFSMHDKNEDGVNNKYFPAQIFRGFAKARTSFVLSSVKAGSKAGTVILSHINLLLVGWLIKKISPATKLILLAHGIEVWDNLPFLKKKMLHACDEIFCVSSYTATFIQQQHGIAASKCKVLNNCLDPFLPAPALNNNKNILSQYGIKTGDPVLFMLTRLAGTERRKGYDKVIAAIAKLKNNFPNIRYVIAGKSDAAEKNYLQQLINSLGLQGHVIFTGYIADEEIAAYFQSADIYVMPSKKEGFGIVFIEAMYYGLPVIAGNKDGSVDALAKGALGILIDPDDTTAIYNAIKKVLENKNAFIPNRELLIKLFSFETYKNNLERLLKN